MCAFIDDGLFHSGETVENDCSCATLDIVDGLLDGEEGDGARYGESVKATKETFCGHDGRMKGCMWFAVMRCEVVKCVFEK